MTRGGPGAGGVGVVRARADTRPAAVGRHGPDETPSLSSLRHPGASRVRATHVLRVDASQFLGRVPEPDESPTGEDPTSFHLHFLRAPARLVPRFRAGSAR